MKSNGEAVQFLMQRDYIMANNRLGKGSFGKTVLLQDPFIDELLVAKKYEPENDADKERFYKNFLDEIKILYKLNHRNIVRIYNYYAYENIFTGYILMEHIDGIDIGNFVSNYSPPFETLTLDEVFSQLIDGFLYIEKHGIVHRDIRETNIMVDKSGIVKIIDFGIGKITEIGHQKFDSLVSEINRATLPQEYYEAEYTTKTDMFYLGELLHRLMDSAEYIDDSGFSYTRVLEKMMQKSPNDRYSGFSDIREAIDRHDFSNMSISEGDKETYQGFSNFLYRSLSSFINERKFNHDTNHFISQLDNVLRINCFEDTVQNNSDVIRSVVIGDYKCSMSSKISCVAIQDFLNWFKQATHQSQQLILNNIIAKLSTIEIKESEPEFPF